MQAPPIRLRLTALYKFALYCIVLYIISCEQFKSGLKKTWLFVQACSLEAPLRT